MFSFTFEYEENNNLVFNDDFLCFCKLYFCNKTRKTLKKLIRLNRTNTNKTELNQTKYKLNQKTE